MDCRFRGNDNELSFLPPLVIPAKAGIYRGGRLQQESRKYMEQYYVYIIASKKNGTLYIGVTNDLIKRVWEHKNKIIDGFTKKYNVHKLMYYENTPDVNSAITREKQMKKWKRQWKIELIEKNNPNSLLKNPFFVILSEAKDLFLVGDSSAFGLRMT